MKDEQIYLLETISHLLNQGFAIDDILCLCKIYDHTSFIEEIETELLHGLTLEEALLKTKLPALFKEYFSFFQNDFSLSDALDKSLYICKRQEAIKKQLRQKLSYPLFMIVFLFIFSIFIILYLLPQVEILFIEFDIKMSFMTQFVFILFKIIPIFLFLSITLLFFIIAIVIFAIKKQRFQYIDFFITHTNLIQNVMKQYYSIKFAIYYNELLENHYDASTIIDILYHRINDSDIQMIVYELYQELVKGYTLEEVIKKFDYFDSGFKKFFSIMMADHFEKKKLNDYIHYSINKIELHISRSIKIFIPLTYGFVACFVIFVYISIIIPMMNVVNHL